MSDARPEGDPIHVHDLTVAYREKRVLEDVDLTIPGGTLVAIIGPNGAGKSTLLKSMLGMLSIRSGTITLRGEDITGRKAHQLVAMGVGFVPQTNNVFPRLTIEENLQMGLYHEPKKFSERFDYVAELFPALATRRKQRAGSLSGGERQMVDGPRVDDGAIGAVARRAVRGPGAWCRR